MVVIRHFTPHEVTGTWYFRTIHDGLEYRNAKIGTDNPGLCEGEWVLSVIGPDILPLGELVLSAIIGWEFTGRWTENGNDFEIIGLNSKEV